MLCLWMGLWRVKSQKSHTSRSGASLAIYHWLLWILLWCLIFLELTNIKKALIAPTYRIVVPLFSMKEHKIFSAIMGCAVWYCQRRVTAIWLLSVSPVEGFSCKCTRMSLICILRGVFLVSLSSTRRILAPQRFRLLPIRKTRRGFLSEEFLFNNFNHFSYIMGVC